jgi:Tfp pilus assembly protein PilV
MDRSSSPVLFSRAHPRNSNSGFALALVLIVVALIGLIVAAISLDTNSNQATATANEDRLAAGVTTRIGAAAGDALSTMVYSKGVRPEKLFELRNFNATPTNPYNYAENITGKTGAWTIPQINPNAYDLAAGTCTQGQFGAMTRLTTQGCFLYFTRIQSPLGSRGNTPTDSTFIVYTAFLSTSVSQQINNLLWQNALTAVVPAANATNPAALGKLGWTTTDGATITTLFDITSNTALPTTVDGTTPAPLLAGTTAAPTLPTINGAQRPEGVYDSNGTTANDDTDGNIYYKVLLAL